MTTAVQNVEALDRKLNDAILSGKALEAFDEFYADDVVMQENNAEPFVGKALNRDREVKFFASVTELHEMKVLASAAHGNVSFGDWLMDVTFQGGTRYRMEQVAVRRWRDGKVMHERFYYKG
jgi:ketosteroid isomerase-like protein